MSWRERLLPAKFRGVPFVMKGHDRSGGRRLAISEVPGAEEPIVQDMGATTGVMRVDALLIGDDVFEQRQALLKALQAAGPGLLVHPWLGQFQAHVKVFSGRESDTEGGVTRFSIEFVRAAKRLGGASGTQAREVRIARVLEAADRTDAKIKASFLSTFKAEGVASFVKEEAAAGIKSLAATLKEQAPRMGGDVTDFLLGIGDLSDSAIEKAAKPLEMAEAVQSQIRNLSNGITGREQAIRTLLYMARALPRVGGGDSSQASIARINRQGFNGLVAGAAFSEVMRRAVAGSWPSWSAAKAAREIIVQAIAAHAASSSMEVWDELHALQAEVSKALPGPKGELPEVRTVQLSETVPSLVLTYRLHGGLSNHEDLILRNAISHPLFVPAAVELEVLSIA